VHMHTSQLHASFLDKRGIARMVASRLASPHSVAWKLSTYIIGGCNRRPVVNQRLHHAWPPMVDSKVQRHLPVRVAHGELGTVRDQKRNYLRLIRLHGVVDERLMVLRVHAERASYACACVWGCALCCACFLKCC
jgi:hypothetical protein